MRAVYDAARPGSARSGRPDPVRHHPRRAARRDRRAATHGRAGRRARGRCDRGADDHVHQFEPDDDGDDHAVPARPASASTAGSRPGRGVDVELRIGDGRSRTTADDDGRFVFEDVPHGLARFVLRPPGRAARRDAVDRALTSAASCGRSAATASRSCSARALAANWARHTRVDTRAGDCGGRRRPSSARRRPRRDLAVDRDVAPCRPASDLGRRPSGAARLDGRMARALRRAVARPRAG